MLGCVLVEFRLYHDEDHDVVVVVVVDNMNDVYCSYCCYCYLDYDDG